MNRLGVRCLPKYWGRWFSPIGEGTMKETDLNIFYHLGATLESTFDHIEIGMDASGLALNLHWPRPWLAAFLKQTEELKKPLKATRDAAQKLLQVMDDIVEDVKRDWHRKMTQEEMWALSQSKAAFE